MDGRFKRFLHGRGYRLGRACFAAGPYSATSKVTGGHRYDK